MHQKEQTLNGEATSYIDDFEGTQNAIDLRAQQSWFLSSRPLDIDGDGNDDEVKMAKVLKMVMAERC